MKQVLCLIAFLLLSASIIPDYQQSWIDTARIAGGVLWADMTDTEMKKTIAQIHERNQSVILTWVSNPFQEYWVQDLEFLTKASDYIHKNYPGMALIVYQGPLEIVTPDVDLNKNGKIDYGVHSVYTDHPEWLQIGIDGRKAVFYGDVAFWVGEHDEDVWICPNDAEYKQLVISHFMQLTQTGIDGIWIDIPKFLCDFGDWEDNWACHCQDCKTKFREDTGLELPATVDWDDTTWKTWIIWRQHVIKDYIKDLNTAVKKVNPDCKIIVEHWHGIDAGSVREAWSPIFLREVTDCLAHEYAAASYTEKTYDYYNYLRDIASYLYYRGLDTDHPSWILAYSSGVEGQTMLAASVLSTGCNFYDTDAPDMSGTVNLHQQEKIFSWIAQHQKYYYNTEPWANTGVYYSKRTMDFYQHDYEADFYCDFMGVCMMLLEFHVPYQVLFSLDDIDRYHTIFLPTTACMSDEEINKINEFVKNGGNVVATGKSGQYDEWGVTRSHNLLSDSAVFMDAVGIDYYNHVSPFYPWWCPESRETGEKAKSQLWEVLQSLDIPSIFEVNGDNIIVLPFVNKKEKEENTLILRILNLNGVSDGMPTPQNFTMHIKWPVNKGICYPFLSSPYTVNTFEQHIEDHAAYVYTITDAVTVINNTFDEKAGQFIVDTLHKEGFPVSKCSSYDCLEELKSKKYLIVLGGHEADIVSDVVSEILTEEEKNVLEKEGAQKIFIKYDIFSQGQIIIIVAGNDREHTLEAAITEIDYILQVLSAF